MLGGAAVAVPSEIFGLRLVWERHGRLPWTRLVLPARTPPGDYVLTVADKSFRGPPAAGAGDAETAGTLLTNLPAVSLPLTVLPPVG